MTAFRSTVNKVSAVVLLCVPGMAFGFNSGSTGADGPFSPTVNTELPLPADGIFNFTTITIPAGVTVTFTKNVTNTPVVILASGDVTIAGTVDVSGGKSPDIGNAGDGNVGDDGQPGVGGPGGYDGGAGGLLGSNTRGSDGLGPGGGIGGERQGDSRCRGGGGGYGTAGTPGNCTTSGGGGPTYGSSLLLPFIGGSGGGGGAAGTIVRGGGGGGGGGAILIASSGTVTLGSSGSLLANGGSAGTSSGVDTERVGGGGSGGAIRILATTIDGDGIISAIGGTGGGGILGFGGDGRIRLEAETLTRTASTSPAFASAPPGAIFIPGLPSVVITSVAGIAAPIAPTGSADITLPAGTPNPVTVVFTTTGIPVGNTIRLTVTPANAAAITADSTPLIGSTASATASASVNLPPGPSVLLASSTFPIVAALGQALAPFAQGERVEKMTVVAVPGAPTRYTFITVSGKEFKL
jgi:hypothetical protein